MIFSAKRNQRLRVLIILSLVWSVGLGVFLGLALGTTWNIQHGSRFGNFDPALPSKVLDINGNVITEFFSSEKRDLVSYNEIPRFLTDALITREDQDFWYHNGFSLKGILRAAFMTLTGHLQGGSTLTQQLAGKLYSDRTQLTLARKLQELWWALELETKFSKEEILEQYMNNMPFGHSTYGVEAASKYFFNHSVKDLTVAESALLVIQLVHPGLYSPIRNPNGAAKVQKDILNQMVQAGYVSAKEAKASYDEYWANYDYSRGSMSTAYWDRTDKAPYFSEYIRNWVQDNLVGPHDLYKDGLVIHTTLNLDDQLAAQSIMTQGIEETNLKFHASNQRRLNVVDSELAPMLDLLGYSFNISELRASPTQYLRDAHDYLAADLSPTIDMAAKLFGISDLENTARETYKSVVALTSNNQVEGALITLQNSTGYITAMVGGSHFDRLNQFNRAVQARVQPGSSFKPLYYSAAIDSRKFTPATMIMDQPTVFINEDGTYYTPSNFRGEWAGPVLLRQALAHSMNVPSIQVLAGIGFDAAIDRAAKLLGITDPAQIAATFPRKYPLALGIISISPLQMARAYAIFANQGREVDPIAVLYIQDRKGNIIANPAADTLNELRRKGSEAQIISPQTAYIMTSLLETTVQSGTLDYARWKVGGLPMEMAGKTGTTQNWADAWAIGYSPYYTTAVWLGFDKPGNSLGLENTGATAAGVYWAEYMKKINEKLPVIPFPRPSTGLQYVRVDAETGLLPSGEPGEHVIDEVFLTGTAPTKISNLEEFRQMRDRVLSRNIDKVVNNVTQKIDNSALDPTLNFDLNGTEPTPPSPSSSPAPSTQSAPASPLNPNLSN
jgi:penicillin-binding protein 1A